MAIPISLIAANSAATSTSTVSKINYLDRCIEEFNPSNAEDAASKILWEDRKSTLWKVAAYASLVVFAILAVGAFITTGILFPVYIPIAGICTLLLLNPVHQFYKRFQSYADQSQGRADQFRSIENHFKDLTGKTSAELAQIVFQKGIVLNDAATLEQVKPLIARHLFWEDHTKKIDAQKQAELDKAQKLSNDNSIEHRQEIYDIRTIALELENRALECKVKNAFINAIIRRPDFAGTLTDVGEISPLLSQERILGQAAGDTSVDQFFTFANKTIAPLSLNDVKRLSVAELGQRLFAAMAA